MTIYRGGKEWFQAYSKGERKSALKSVGKSEKTGTEINFKPDMSIFSDITEFDFEQINTRLRRTAFLNAGLQIILRDNRGESQVEIEHKYEGGLKEYVQAMNKNKEVIHEAVLHILGSTLGDKGEVHDEVAMQWTDAYSESVHCFTNIIHNSDAVSYTHQTLPTIYSV